MDNLVLSTFGRRKLKILSWSVIINFLIVSCAADAGPGDKKATVIQGNTQGTTYSIILPNGENITKKEIDGLLKDFDSALSGYVDYSLLTKMNECDSSITLNDEFGYFVECYKISQHVYETTNGSFDPSVMPLVKGYGFISNDTTPLTDLEIDSLLRFVSFKPDHLHSLTSNGKSLNYMKKITGYQLDFNAVAQGYSVDVVADYLEKNLVTDYYIEIGGELRVKGKNREGKNWQIGVDSPNQEDGKRVITEILAITDKGIATSGNYRKFYIKDGKKYSHTINPKSGRPVDHSLLSATVVADKAGLADAYATAFMVMGTEKTIDFVKNHKEEGLEIYLIYSNSKGELEYYKSEGFAKYLRKK